MHCMWDKAFFALKPLSSTDRDVTVQFYWLKRSAKAVEEDLDGFESAMQTVCGGNTRDWGTPQPAHRPSDLRIETGQLFTIRANTPEELPSVELLELQWNLLRISAMCERVSIGYCLVVKTIVLRNRSEHYITREGGAPSLSVTHGGGAIH